MNDEPLQICKGCGLEFPISQFPMHNGARSKYCAKCTALYRKRNRARNRLHAGTRSDRWDWAAMLCKSKKAAAKVKREPFDDTTFDAEVLRCILVLQHGRCAISGECLLMPDPTLHMGIGAKQWMDSLTDIQAGRAIDIVRPDARAPWAPGNIMIVRHMYAVLYAHTGTFTEFRNACQQALAVKTVVYDKTTISSTRSNRAKARMDAAALHEEIPWDV